MLNARGLFAVTLLALVVGHAACASDPASNGDPAKSACQNGVRDEGESGVDCGGACGKCPGEPCTGGSDCGSGSCENNVCQEPTGPGEGPPSATDGKKNNDETDVDCGGPNAPACADGKSCAVDKDCATGWCKPEENKCVAPRNDDGVKNGTETDVDCGGESGKKCDEGLACLADTDCNGACNYADKCVDVKSCKPHFGGDTCGGKPLHPGEQGDMSATATNESCCRTLPVTGYTDPKNPGKTVFVDKYEVTAGRVRAFVAAIAAANNGQPDIKAWVTANKPPIWSDDWSLFMPSGNNAASVTVPRQPTNPPQAQPWNRNVGADFVFGGPLYIYVHGHNCANAVGDYGFPTFWYPDAVLTARGEAARPAGFDGAGGMIPAQEALDVKSMTCIPSALLAAFCHWDGGQLATDEVLDFITNTPANVGNAAGCGSRCAPINDVHQSSDSGNAGNRYNFPFFPNGVTNDGSPRIATPGRIVGDVVRINAGDEPWMDLHGNVHEIVLDMTGATFTGNFGLKYRGIGYSSARAGGNNGPPAKFLNPEYKAGYSGGRCMRWK
ncbi:MAG: hypothetical protein KF764_19300 [Labilithrix sp.]|nr:hypothetical protein [Labilithrix sp.]